MRNAETMSLISSSIIILTFFVPVLAGLLVIASQEMSGFNQWMIDNPGTCELYEIKEFAWVASGCSILFSEYTLRSLTLYGIYVLLLLALTKCDSYDKKRLSRSEKSISGSIWELASWGRCCRAMTIWRSSKCFWMPLKHCSRVIH